MAIAPVAISAESEHERLYVVRRGWHIDVGIEADRAAGPLAELRAQFPEVRYLLFGFGDRRYLESHHRVPALLGALWPGDGLILVTALRGSPAQAFGQDSVVVLELSDARLAAALERVIQTLQLQGGRLQSDGPGPYRGSLYLRASQRYSALHTCNTWAAEVLAAGGFNIHSRGVLFAAQLWRQVRAPPQAAAAGRTRAATTQP
ncbi:MAG: DUF2459 domain-containing protein [Steroidobacteraceae bacterium]